MYIILEHHICISKRYSAHIAEMYEANLECTVLTLKTSLGESDIVFSCSVYFDPQEPTESAANDCL